MESLLQALEPRNLEGFGANTVRFFEPGRSFETGSSFEPGRSFKLGTFFTLKYKYLIKLIYNPRLGEATARLCMNYEEIKCNRLRL